MPTGEAENANKLVGMVFCFLAISPRIWDFLGLRNMYIHAESSIDYFIFRSLFMIFSVEGVELIKLNIDFCFYERRTSHILASPHLNKRILFLT